VNSVPHCPGCGGLSSGSPRGWGHILGCGAQEFAKQTDHDAHFRATGHNQSSHQNRRNKWGHPDQEKILIEAFQAIGLTPDALTLDKFAKALRLAEL